MAATIDIETPRAFVPLLEPARYKGAHGGRGSGKSWFFASLLIERFLIDPTLRAVCVREIQKSLAESVKKLLEDTIERMGVGGRFQVQDKRIVTPEGGLILFQGLQNHTAQSIKSLEGHKIAWVEEAQSLSQFSLDLLIPTIRQPGSEIWFSWNPFRQSDPVDKFLRGDVKPEGAVVVEASYRDNPWFMTSAVVSDMERDRARDPEKYAHVWLGGYERHSEARVFKNWTVVKKADWTQAPADVRYYFGADWGFAEDPTVLVRCYIVGRSLFVDREAYDVHREIDHTAALFDALDPERPGMARHWPIVADSARPETISYLQRHGYPRIQPAKKGAGSVEEGVTFLQNYDIFVHERCTHTIDELTAYAYEMDKLTGDVLPKLEDKKNHVIDALRYATEGLRHGGAFGTMHVPWL